MSEGHISLGLALLRYVRICNNALYSYITEELYRVCTKCQTCEAIHSQEPDPVQVMGFCHLAHI